MTTKTAFKFDLGQAVATASGAAGTVQARTEFGDGKPPDYLIRFDAAPQRNSWFNEIELGGKNAEPAEEPAAAKTVAKGKK